MQNAFTAAASTSSASGLPQLRFCGGFLPSWPKLEILVCAAIIIEREQPHLARQREGDLEEMGLGAGDSPGDLWACGTI